MCQQGGRMPFMAVTETRQEAVLIDAGVFIGALLTGDPRHAEARPLVEQAREGILPACTTTSILRADAGAEGERHPRPHARLLPISQLDIPDRINHVALTARRGDRQAATGCRASPRWGAPRRAGCHPTGGWAGSGAAGWPAWRLHRPHRWHRTSGIPAADGGTRGGVQSVCHARIRRAP